MFLRIAWVTGLPEGLLLPVAADVTPIVSPHSEQERTTGMGRRTDRVECMVVRVLLCAAMMLVFVLSNPMAVPFAMPHLFRPIRLTTRDIFPIPPISFKRPFSLLVLLSLTSGTR